MFDKNGCSVSVTMRGTFVDDWAYVLYRRAGFMDKALAAGWTVGGPKQPTTPPAARNEDAGRPTERQRPPSRHENGGDSGLTFQAEELCLTIDSGKEYYKVKGGRFKKFGVTIWPEVLEECGIDPQDVDPRRGMSLKGYTARYVENDDGKAQKVTALERF